MDNTKETLATAADAVAFIVRKADDYANRFGFGVGGALSFDSQVKLDHYLHLLDLAKEIRALDGRASAEARTEGAGEKQALSKWAAECERLGFPTTAEARAGFRDGYRAAMKGASHD